MNYFYVNLNRVDLSFFQMRLQSVAGPHEARAAADEAVQGGQGGRAPLRHGQGPSRGHDVQAAEGSQGDCQLEK